MLTLKVCQWNKTLQDAQRLEVYGYRVVCRTDLCAKLYHRLIMSSRTVPVERYLLVVFIIPRCVITLTSLSVVDSSWMMPSTKGRIWEKRPDHYGQALGAWLFLLLRLFLSLWVRFCSCVLAVIEATVTVSVHIIIVVAASHLGPDGHVSSVV